ncbi:hypothetical protein B1691_12990 [Geobacillus sp. 47C-IIb]|jgi:hypothetical protein|nr:hypothetical protein [Geobacillus thermodenitrificans]OQP08945.1 hypothetical protein B1691_12990 [Geobacillus sp. 47C-IIb]PJW19299.1 hypothetical protein CV632_16980 [Geobacillus thermodenitrificans]
MKSFQTYNKVVEIKDTSKSVQSVKVTLVCNDVKQGEVNITDLMLQGGRVATNWSYHPSEIRWSHDG